MLCQCKGQTMKLCNLKCFKFGRALKQPCNRIWAQICSWNLERRIRNILMLDLPKHKYKMHFILSFMYAFVLQFVKVLILIYDLLSASHEARFWTQQLFCAVSRHNYRLVSTKSNTLAILRYFENLSKTCEPFSFHCVRSVVELAYEQACRQGLGCDGNGIAKQEGRGLRRGAFFSLSLHEAGFVSRYWGGQR